tara:strand:- start:132 stop:332 length:201 start_codon:yes stop_codon:yes gene_type:complete
MSLIGIEVPSERVTGVDRSKQLLAATAVSKASNDAKSILVLLLFCAFVKEIRSCCHVVLFPEVPNM